ncbi:MAG TPA: hypothetical protein PLB28_08645 [Bacteroidales bacterium]|jgi:putative transposase|nr:hypothetical protein [Bacteroidales bacterium]HPS25635.1 hypothetical protein [Bacteroidales bacterium]
MRGKLWHVSVQGNGAQSLFLDESDVLHFIDILGVYSYYYGCQVWAYNILSNHFHLILEGDNLQRFIQVVRISYSKYYQSVHCTIGSVGRRGYSVGLLNNREKLLEKVIYVLRNSVKHKVYPHSYVDPYNSAKYYFLANRADPIQNLYPAGPGRRLPYSKKQIPEHYLIEENGHIYPRSFLKFTSIEKVFVSFNNFMKLITYPQPKESEDHQRKNDILGLGDDLHFVQMTDLQLSAKILEKIRPRQLSSLSDTDIVSLAILCKRMYPVSVRQLSRVFGYPESTLRWRMQGEQRRLRGTRECEGKRDDQTRNGAQDGNSEN